MATYSSHRLIMEKWNLTISSVSLEIFEFFFTDRFNGKSCTIHMTFVHSVSPSPQKGHGKVLSAATCKKALLSARHYAKRTLLNLLV